MSYCPHCGSPIEEHANFCGSCGKPIGTAVPSTPNPAAPVSANTVGDNNNEPEDNNVQNLLKLVVAVLLVGIVMLVIVLLRRCGNSTKPVDASIADTAIVDYVMVNGHKFVDLGLPSGVKWATCNVGANSPEEDGGYFAWGETKPKSDYSWDTYKWGDGYTFTKYTLGGKTTLDAADDAATQNWGQGCRMPTVDEFEELFNNTTREWTTLNGVNGYKFTSETNSEAFVFLPASGTRYEDGLYYHGSYGYYWSSSLNPNDRDDYAYYLGFDSGDCGWDDDGRYFGLTVRAVCP